MLYYDLVYYTMPNSERLRKIQRRTGEVLSTVALLGLLSGCAEPWPEPRADAVPPSDTPSHLLQDAYGEQNPETDNIHSIYDELMKTYLPRLATELRWTEQKGESAYDLKGIQSRFPGTDSLILYTPLSIDGTPYVAYLFPKSDQLKRRGGFAVIPDSPHVVLVRLDTEQFEGYLTDNQDLIARVLRTVYADVPSLTTREMQVTSLDTQGTMYLIRKQWESNEIGTVRIEDYLFAPDSNWEHDEEDGVWRRPLSKTPKTCLTGC